MRSRRSETCARRSRNQDRSNRLAVGREPIPGRCRATSSDRLANSASTLEGQDLCAPLDGIDHEQPCFTPIARSRSGFHQQVGTCLASRAPGLDVATLQFVQNNHPRKYCRSPRSIHRVQDGHSPGEDLQRLRRSTRCSISSTGPQHDFVCRGTACHTRGSRDLFEKVMMHLGFAAGRRMAKPDKLSMTTPDWPVHHPHGRLLRPVRAGAGDRDRSRDLRPHERAAPCSARWMLSEQREPRMSRIREIEHIQRGPRRPDWRSSPRAARASPSAWARAAPATAPKASTRRSPTPSTSDGLDIALVQTGCFGVLLGGAAGGRLDARPAARHPAPRPGRPRSERSSTDSRRGASGPTSPVQDRGMGPRHRRTIDYRHGHPASCRLARDPVLQRAEEDRPPQLRPHRAGRHRRVHRRRRIPGAV